MPTLVSHVPINLHKLLQNRTATASAFGRKPGRVMEMTINASFMLVI